MIKWPANFNIEGVTMQCAVAYVEVSSYKNVSGKCIADVIIYDELKQTPIKQYQKTFDSAFNNIEEVYSNLLLDFEGAELE